MTVHTKSLTAAIGRYPHTEALFTHPDGLSLQPFPIISRAFAPMVREERFDVAEMAVATLLQARAHGSDLVLLPVALAARSQNAALLRRVDRTFGPGDLRGRRIGVRAYSQTTAMWLRGMLHESFGLLPQELRWTTFEDAHVEAFIDPPWASRAAPGKNLLGMLRDGTLDAAIVGNDAPDDPAFTTVYPDPAAAGEAFLDLHGFVPVNHVVVLRAEVARRPGLIASLMGRFAAARAALPAAATARLPFGRYALEPAMMLALQYASAQGLLPRPLSMDEVWAGLPADV